MMTRTGRRRFPILFAAIAALLVFIAVDAASSPVQAQATDASLSSLSLTDSLGDDIELSPTFSAATTSYKASVDSDVTSTTVTAETTDEDATTAITINYVEDADGTVDLVPGYNDITVMVTAQDGTTTQTYTVTVLRAQPDDDTTSTDDTITSLLSLVGATLTDAPQGTYHNQAVGYFSNDNFYDVNSQGSLNTAGFNYPAGFGPWYTVEAVVAIQEGQPGDIGSSNLYLEVRGTVTSVASSGTFRAHVLPSGAGITLHLDEDNFPSLTP